MKMEVVESTADLVCREGGLTAQWDVPEQGNLAIGNAGPIRLNEVRLHFWCQSILLRLSEIIHAPITNHLGVAQN